MQFLITIYECQLQFREFIRCYGVIVICMSVIDAILICLVNGDIEGLTFKMQFFKFAHKAPCHFKKTENNLIIECVRLKNPPCA